MTEQYRPVDPLVSPRFSGIKTFMRLPHVATVKDVDFAIIGIPSDAGASFRTGQRAGAAAIRHVSALLRHHNPILGISPFEYIKGIDYGDLPVVPGYIEATNNKIEESLDPIIDAGVIPISLGGDHGITLPELRAVRRKQGPVALLHFDSHSDTEDQYFGKPHNHGTPFRRAVEENLILPNKSIQLGLRGSIYSPDHLNTPRQLGFEIVTAEEMHEMGVVRVIDTIRTRIGNAKVFLTFDIDFVDPAYAPGTGTPEIGGFTSRETLQIVRGVKDLNFIGFDLVEVLPAYDPSQITALLAANIIYEFISIIAYQKRNH
ncbi:MAG: agmatinase [Candidatus Bathyarchaeota archaeon]|jgi:agmatinase|nr:agmatinase [Candidatus Bathyarchaeota archaeon]